MFENRLDALIANLLTQSPIETVFRAQLVKDANGAVTPMYFNSTDYQYCGASDSEGIFAYFRERGEIRMTSIGSAGMSHTYSIEQGFRLVICGKGRSYNTAKATLKLLTTFRKTDFVLSAIYTDRNTVFDMEQQNNKGVLFMPTDLYIAFDFTGTKTDDLEGCKEALDCYKDKNKWQKCEFEPKDFSSDFDSSFS